MELTGAAVRRSPASSFRSTARRMPSRVSCVGGGGGGFADEGHLRYYEASPRKTRKAVEAVARDLSKLQAMGIVAGDQAKEKVLSEAAELLMMELNQMRDEEEGTKKKQKEEKAAMKALKKQQKEAKKAAAMNREDSSSSESSESECEEEQLVQMSRVATIAAPQTQLSEQSMVNSTAVPQFAACDVSRVPAMVCDNAVMKEMKKRAKEEKRAAKKAMKMKREEKAVAAMNCCKDEDNSSCSSLGSSDSECEEEVIRMSCSATITAPRMPPPSTILPIVVPQIPESLGRQPCQDVLEPVNAMPRTSSSITVVERQMMSRIEVCMGGKCKKSGSPELLQEFEKRVGTEGMVVGCKCMGKCGLGPNVRLRNQGSEEGSVQKNPLCIGVGLEDVGTIVAGFFGDNELGLKAA